MSQGTLFRPNEWMIIGFATIILIGTALLRLPIASTSGASIEWVDALFTAASAVCVTGLTVVDTASTFTLFGEVVIMVLIQIGGLGFMTFGAMIALLLGKKLGLKGRLLIAQSTNALSASGLVRLCILIFGSAFVLQMLGSLLFAVHTMEQAGFLRAWYYGVFLSISAFNNAGFALWPDNMVRYAADPIVNIIVTLLIILGGIGFTVLMDLRQKKKWIALTVQSKMAIVATFVLIVVGTLGIWLLEHGSDRIGYADEAHRWWTAYFHSVSARTAGFNSVVLSEYLMSTQVLLIFLMFIGGSSGGTAGGIKTNTLMVLLFAMASSIKGREHVIAFRRKIAMEAVLRALTVLVASLIVVLFVSFLLTLTEDKNFSFIDLLFEVTSAFSTTGLSLDVTPYLTDFGKCALIVTMFIGRLGPIAIAFALASHRKESDIGYAEEKVLIG
jgi:trk system potassium uptake protein TrkH